MSCNLKKNKLKKIFAFLGFAPLLTSCFFFTSCGNSNNINLSNIVIPESESVSKDNFAIFNAYDPSEVTMSEILQINKDNYVQKIISDNIKKIDNNFSFKDINISNSAKNTTYQDGKEQYIDYSFDSYKKTFNQCEIYVKSNCSKYFGEFSFKINVCATNRQCIYKDENFSDDYPSELFCFYTTLDLKLYNHNSKTWVDEEMLKNNFLSSISTDKNQVFQLSCISCYRKIFPCLRDDDISIDVSKKIDLEIDSYNLEDSSITCDISMYTKVNTNSDNQNSLLTFNYDEARCKIKTTFISKRFDISNISDDFRSTLNDVFPSTKTVDSNEIIPWVNINSVPASYIRQYIYDRLSNKFLTLLETKYTPFAYSISGEDYTPYLSYFNFDVIPANTQIKDKYDLSKPVLFKIQIIPLLGSLFYGSIGLSSSVSDAMLIQLKSVNYSVSLNQLSVQQDSIFSLFSVPGESANKVPKERLLSLLDNNSELSVILENKISSLLETDYRPKRDDKKISLDYDYSLSIENYSSFNNYIDFSKTVCVSIKIEANSSSIYLRDSKILNFWIKYSTQKYNLTDTRINLPSSNVYNFYAFKVDQCSKTEVKSLEKTKKLYDDILNQLLTTFFCEGFPISLLSSKNEFDISILDFTETDFSTIKKLDVQISASINSSFFSGTSNTFAINVLAFESIFDLSNVLISSPITVNIFTLGDTNYKLTDELIKNLNISNLNNKMFQQPVSIIEAAVSDVCSAASLNEDYEIQLPLSSQDTYDSTHPLVEGKLVPKNTSKVVGESKINFKINIVQYEQIENTQYVGSFNMFQNSSYTASANMFDKSNQKGVPDNWRDNEIDLNFTLDNDVYQYLTFSYDSHGLYELKDWVSGDDSTCYTLKQLTEMGIIIQSQLPTDYSPTYMFLTITQQLNPNLTVNFKTLNKTKNNSFDFNMYNKYDLQTESFDNIDSIKISNKIKPFSEYHTHTWEGNIRLSNYGKSILFVKYPDSTGQQRLHIIFSDSESCKNDIYLTNIENYQYGTKKYSEFQTPMVVEKYKTIIE